MLAPSVASDPVVAAATAHLHYVSDRTPGISRVRAGDGFVYRGPDGRMVRDPETFRRIKSLRVPEGPGGGGAVMASPEGEPRRCVLQMKSRTDYSSD